MGHSPLGADSVGGIEEGSLGAGGPVEVGGPHMEHGPDCVCTALFTKRTVRLSFLSSP